jgi:hypothetical protein
MRERHLRGMTDMPSMGMVEIANHEVFWGQKTWWV